MNGIYFFLTDWLAASSCFLLRAAILIVLCCNYSACERLLVHLWGDGVFTNKGLRSI